MIPRLAAIELEALARQFKSVAVVGPRQSGKTTLVRYLFGNKPYVSLENPDSRRFAIEDPRGFLGQYPDGAVLDEIQRTPDLFSYLQQRLDENPAPGQFILTGSNNLLLQESISQSLAGRIAYLFLLPLSIDEIGADGLESAADLILKGSYPPVYDQPVEPPRWYANYIRTYIERDVRQLKNITDLDAFERVIRLCAGRTGQMLNMSNLAIEAGVDAKTIGSWIGILEQSFIVHRLQPHHRNFNKRVVKMPKLYFYDTGLACALLGIQTREQLIWHPLFGSLFENLMVSELIKNRFNKSMPDNLFFWRDNNGSEIDVLLDTPQGLFPIEIKSGQTITSEYFKGLLFWQKHTGQSGGIILYAGTANEKRSNGIEILPWKQVGKV
ncbi:MAG: ATP-binding protein [Bacteroidales bacterium]